MDFNIHHEVEMIRRMANGIHSEFSSNLIPFFRDINYRQILDSFDPLFESFFMDHNDRPRSRNPRHERSLASSLITNQVARRQRAGSNNNHNNNNIRRPRIRITLSPSENSRLQQHHSQTESSTPNEPASLCDYFENDSSDNEICAICREIFKEKDTIRQLPCMHLFHPECLRPWLHRNNTCPTCRHHL